MLLNEIAVTANRYEETKKILLAQYGDTNRIIQVHLDFLESLPPATFATPDELNTTFIEYHRRIQALRNLGEDVNGYGRVLVPNILNAFPPRTLPVVDRQFQKTGPLRKKSFETDSS